MVVDAAADGAIVTGAVNVGGALVLAALFCAAAPSAVNAPSEANSQLAKQRAPKVGADLDAKKLVDMETLSWTNVRSAFDAQGWHRVIVARHWATRHDAGQVSENR